MLEDGYSINYIHTQYGIDRSQLLGVRSDCFFCGNSPYYQSQAIRTWFCKEKDKPRNHVSAVARFVPILSDLTFGQFFLMPYLALNR